MTRSSSHPRRVGSPRFQVRGCKNRAMSGERFLILADGQLGVFSSKTATSVLRYRGGDVAAVLDRENAGGSTAQLLGVPVDVPIVATLSEGLNYKPTALLIGIAPPGGALPAEW